MIMKYEINIVSLAASGETPVRSNFVCASSSMALRIASSHLPDLSLENSGSLSPELIRNPFGNRIGVLAAPEYQSSLWNYMVLNIIYTIFLSYMSIYFR